MLTLRKNAVPTPRDPRSLWNTINALTGRMKTCTPPQASVKDLSDFFASVVTDPNRPIQLTEPGTTTAPHRLLDCFQKVEESTVLELLQSIDDRKSAGSDAGGLPGCIFKNYAKDLTPSVIQLINASLTSSELPTPLKLATVSPIFKNGDPFLATQYRPISLLPLVSKLLEKVVARQLRSYLEEFSIIPKEQFAYRQHHSTEDALVYAINNFLMAKDQGLYTGLVFVDMSKAFDRVEHQTLINDLSNIGVRGSALKWFINYLTDRQQQVRCGNTVSAPTSCSTSWSSARQCPWTAPVFTVYKKGTGGSLRNKDHQVRTLCRRHIDILQWKDTNHSRGLSVWSCNTPGNLAGCKGYLH